MNGKIELPKMATIQECAELSGLAKYAIRRLVLENKIKFIKLGKKYLVNFDNLVEYLNNGETKTNIEIENSNKIRKVGE